MIDSLKVYTNILRYPIFPCHSSGPKSKAPLTPHGFKDATCNLEQIEQWHQQYPNCAWAVATSAERAVLDIDPRHNGHITLAQLVSQHGQLPATPRVCTGGGGWHYWLRCPEGTRCRNFAEGIDFKADGGYVIISPSQIDIPEHQGRAYTWEIRPWEIPLAPAPAWLLATKPEATPKAISAGAQEDVADPWVVRESKPDFLTHPGCDSSKGEKRRPTLCSLLGVHFARGDSPDTIFALAEAWANRCNPPLTESEWRKHYYGFLKKEQAKAEAAGMTPIFISGDTDEGLSDADNGKEGSMSNADSKNTILPSFPNIGNSNSQAESEILPSFLPDAPRDEEKNGIGVIQEHEAKAKAKAIAIAYSYKPLPPAQ